MGESGGWAEPLPLPLPNGLMRGAGPIMRALEADRWLKAEERTAELISCIQPNQLSEERRNAVADYVQRLIMNCFPCQVCTFGSVPLKTYLPDGDIDLTAFSHNQNLKDTWAHQVRDVLESEEKNENAEFHVKEVQYIQAEVKIIKCLVENIVVDISFNQVGGLCTLCFLDEVDNLISQNHLFKRSIILIKAWCYYESRILGAHHGLISTYALETLVLYIFHVFNNSFLGPLEVLYRFLEFFSNFDWDNFCVSLWGPVPISSLPDVTAESPRKDSSELLLSKLFLDACSSVYAVFPAGQENNGQPFVAKHFNVIDPLRVNNNLGRSVSKGNFFRIRSALAFGAKKLARLLDCPKENLKFEVNQFFMNTWERHGSGHRPDAAVLDSRQMTVSTPEEFDSSNDKSSRAKVNGNSFAHGVEGYGVRAHGVSSRDGENSAKMAPITSELSAGTHEHNFLNQFSSTSLEVNGQIRRDTASDQVELNEVQREDFKDNHLLTETQGRFRFARTRSSPELTDICKDVSYQLRGDKAETVHSHATNARLDNSSRRKNVRSESLASHSSRSSVEDTSSSRHAPSQKSLDAAADSNSGSNSYHHEFGLDTLSGEFSSSRAQMMQQEEQDIVNMMSSASLQGFNGQVHVPFNLTSGHLPFPIPPSFLASMGYNQRNLPGFLPTNFPLFDPSFSNMHYPHGLVSPQLTHYFPDIGLNIHAEDSVDRSNEIFSPSEVNSREPDLWQEQDVGSSGGYDPEKGNFNMLRTDDRQPPASPSGSKYGPPFRVGTPVNDTRVQQRHSREKRTSTQDTRSSEVYADERSVSSKFSSATHSNSLRSRTSSESSWDGSLRSPNFTKANRGKKVISKDLTALHGKGIFLSENMSNHSEEDEQEWGSLSNAGAEMVERTPRSDPDGSLPVPRHHIFGPEVAETSGSDSVIPFAPVLLGPGSKQRMSDNRGLVAFYPTGPPIPFLTMLPVYNVPPEAGTSEASNNHVGGDETLDNSESGQNFSQKGFHQPEDLGPSRSLRGSMNVETSEEQRSDILSSDFSSHWQNLQFGRLCQSPRYQGPLLYPPVMVPPVYLQGRFPYDNPVRPISTNANIFSQLMTSYGHRLGPVSPSQSVSSRPPNMYQGYMDDIPRYRTGTGTYLPNPKVSPRERQSPGTRRGNYNYDRNESYGDREGNWNANSKPRGAGRSNNRSQNDKLSSRTERLSPSEGRADRSWNAHRHDPAPTYQTQNGTPRSNSIQNGPQNVAYNMYPVQATHPSGISNEASAPPFMMLYPFDPNTTYGSHGEQLEFGSLGHVGFPVMNEQLQSNEATRARAFEDHLLHGNSHCSSPDQPSSPHRQSRRG